jgi:hypothetical protein
MTHSFAATPGQTAFHSAGGDLGPVERGFLIIPADLLKWRRGLRRQSVRATVFSTARGKDEPASVMRIL